MCQYQRSYAAAVALATCYVVIQDQQAGLNTMQQATGNRQSPCPYPPALTVVVSLFLLLQLLAQAICQALLPGLHAAAEELHILSTGPCSR